MLSIFSIGEALDYLSQETRRSWSESEFFDFVTSRNISLHAVAPRTATTTVQRFEPGKGLIEIARLSPGRSLLAVVFAWQLAEIWMRGETYTSHPSDHDLIEGEYKFFVEPVRVIREDIRIRSESMARVLELFAARWTAPELKPESGQLRSKAQEAAILSELQRLNYNPLRLPDREKGKPGPRAEIKEVLLKNAQLFTAKSFEKAWDRLRADGRIVGAL